MSDLLVHRYRLAVHAEARTTSTVAPNPAQRGSLVYEQSGDEALRRVLEAVSQDSETLRMLQSEPDALAKKYGLTPEAVTALKRADVLLSLRPLRRKEVTFETGTTITAGRMRDELTFETGTTITAGIRDLLRDIAEESRTLQRLRTDPESLIDELGIDRNQLDRLKNVRTNVVLRGRSITFQTGSTIEV